jgi:hypothetical protein
MGGGGFWIKKERNVASGRQHCAPRTVDSTVDGAELSFPGFDLRS